MKNTKWFWTKFWVGFFSVVAVGFASAILIKEGTGGSVALPAPQPDDVAIVSAPGGDGDGTGAEKIIIDKTGGYYFSLPGDWYFEKNAGAGVSVYPDYSPTGAAAATCKIEVSVFAVGDTTSGTDLNTWLSNYLGADPTADISEKSISQIQISGEASALEWRGTMNGATTTLIYAQASGARGKILEIAPSTLEQTSDADNDDCDPALQTFLSNLTIGNYGK